MCQPLLYADFRWVDDVDNFDVTTIATDLPMDYLLKVNLEYSQHLHNAHFDLLHNAHIQFNRFIQHARNLLVSEKTSSSRHRIIKSVTSYNILSQQCTRHGLRIAKVHCIRAISVTSQYYIELTRTTNSKKIYKLMNVIFGKTMKNVRFVTHWDGRYGTEAMIRIFTVVTFFPRIWS